MSHEDRTAANSDARKRQAEQEASHGISAAYRSEWRRAASVPRLSNWELIAGDRIIRLLDALEAAEAERDSRPTEVIYCNHAVMVNGEPVKGSFAVIEDSDYLNLRLRCERLEEAEDLARDHLAEINQLKAENSVLRAKGSRSAAVFSELMAEHERVLRQQRDWLNREHRTVTFTTTSPLITKSGLKAENPDLRAKIAKAEALANELDAILEGAGESIRAALRGER